MLDIPYTNHSIGADFFAPLSQALAQCSRVRDCTTLTDSEFLHLGVQRVIDSQPSGRGFLQSHGLVAASCPQRSTYFAALSSPRRLQLTEQVASLVQRTATRTLPDALAAFPQLTDWDVYAADGHFLEAATHDEKSYRRGAKDNLAKFCTGHVFALSLRHHGMTYFALVEQVKGRKEHEIKSLQRLSPAQWRQGAPVGRKVLYVYDPAIIDFILWYRLKQNGVYIITRVKANLCLTKQADWPWEKDAEINAGVVSDELVDGGGSVMRKVSYEDPTSGEVYEFLTNIVDKKFPPGLIAMLYKMRWDVEKVFEETKIKLGEAKAWASSPEAKQAQAQMVCITHNLMLLYEQKLEKEQGITNTAEIARRQNQLSELEKKVLAQGRKLNLVTKTVQRITQRSVKFIRWLRMVLLLKLPADHAYAYLRELYRCT